MLRLLEKFSLTRKIKTQNKTNYKEFYNIGSFFQLHPDCYIKADKLLERYRCEFKIKPKNINIASDKGMMLYIFPLIDELKRYYNNELCISSSISKVVCENNNMDIREKAYHCENIIFRFEAAWEYLFIILSEFLQTNLIIGHDIKDDIMEAKCNYIEFIKHSSGYKIKTTSVDSEKRREIEDYLSSNLKIFKIAQKNKNNSVYKAIEENYCMNERMQTIFDIYKLAEVKKIVDLRNEIVHRRSLGARFSMGKGDILPGQVVSINNSGWYPLNDLPNLIEKNLVAIRDAIYILYEMIFYNDVPNTKVNKNIVFEVHKISCKNCNKNSVIDDFHVDIGKKYGVGLICPRCSSEEIDILQKEKVNERFYFSLFLHYSKLLYEYLGNNVQKD